MLLGGIKLPILAADPIDNPSAGKIFIYIVGSSVKYKIPSGEIFTLSTGVTAEEVEDIVGAFFKDSPTISVTYNDETNQLTASVNNSELDHLLLKNKGTNTHAQIDNHIEAINNPHVVTKVQIGLGNCENTADLDKPISTATQLALDAKANTTHSHIQLDTHIADANNPHVVTKTQVGLCNCENTADLDKPVSNATQVALGNKSNIGHTHPASEVVGLSSHITNTENPHVVTKTQVGLSNCENTSDLNKPISNATQAALNNKADKTVTISGTSGLTGGGDLSANRTLSLSDTPVIPGVYGTTGVPVITVDQKGRINNIVSGPAFILGDYFEEFIDDSPFSTTSSSLQVAAGFTTSNKIPGKYRIGAYISWTNNSTSYDSIIGIYVDGVLQDNLFNQELQDQSSTPWLNWFGYVNFSGTTVHTLEVRACSERCGINTTIKIAKFEIWRVG